MTISFDTIKTTVCSIPNRAIQEAGKLGSFTINSGYKLLKKEGYTKPDTFELTNKETILGIGITGIALVLAIKCIKEITHKVKEMREK